MNNDEPVKVTVIRVLTPKEAWKIKTVQGFWDMASAMFWCGVGAGYGWIFGGWLYMLSIMVLGFIGGMAASAFLTGLLINTYMKHNGLVFAPLDEYQAWINDVD